MRPTYLARLSAADLLAKVNERQFLEDLANRAVALGRIKKPSLGEQKAWRKSFSRLAADLVDAGLGEIDVFLEYEIDAAGVRGDAVLSGRHPVSGEPSYVLVELKQWVRASPHPKLPYRCFLPGQAKHKPNPVHQVRGFCVGLLEVHGAMRGRPERLAGVAYLHDATSAGVGRLADALPVDVLGQIYTAETRGKFLKMLCSRLSAEPCPEASDKLANATISAGRNLDARVGSVLRGEEQFQLLGEQVPAYDAVWDEVRRAIGADGKSVVVITGGPGTGKSAVALQLLRDLYATGHDVISCNGTRAYMEVMRKAAGGGKAGLRHLFRYNNAFMAAPLNGLDVLICDEAHGIRAKSMDRKVRSEVTKGRSQLLEIMDAARVSVFLLDDFQGVRPIEVGSVDIIRKQAKARGAEFRHYDLRHQFRCGGSRQYVDWVHRTLRLTSDAFMGPWQPDGRMQIRTAESPKHMTSFLADMQNEENAVARITAGFCWPWSDPDADGRLVDDVTIGTWAKPWNSGAKAVRHGAPRAEMWAVQDGGFGQIGCVYTARGLEYDWGGVILGPDLVWRDGEWVCDRSASHDRDLRSATDVQFDVCVRQAYKVLLTRARVGTVVHSVDPETQALLNTLVPGTA
jgi:uncharacterized protein